jgi:hypothetical protein
MHGGPLRIVKEIQMGALTGVSTGAGVPGVRGDAGGTDNDGIQGFTQSVARAGVIGINTVAGVGVKGVSDAHDAVQGFSKSADHAGIAGANTAGVGVRGLSDAHDGVQGFTKSNQKAGVVGTNTGNGEGILGQCDNGVGVRATSTHGTGLVASGGKLAGLFDGDVNVRGHLTVNAIPVALVGQDAALQQGFLSLAARVASLEQLVGNLQQELAALETVVATK